MIETPILKCFPINDKEVKAWCPQCGKYHYHSYTDDLKHEHGTSHRVSHCPIEKSLHKTYYLERMTKNELGEIINSVYF